MDLPFKRQYHHRTKHNQGLVLRIALPYINCSNVLVTKKPCKCIQLYQGWSHPPSQHSIVLRETKDQPLYPGTLLSQPDEMHHDICQTTQGLRDDSAIPAPQLAEPHILYPIMHSGPSIPLGKAYLQFHCGATAPYPSSPAHCVRRSQHEGVGRVEVSAQAGRLAGVYSSARFRYLPPAHIESTASPICALSIAPRSGFTVV